MAGKTKINPERFRFSLNGRELRGFKKRPRGGHKLIWYWVCDSWPEVQTIYPKETIVDRVAEEFIRRELCR